MCVALRDGTTDHYQAQGCRSFDGRKTENKKGEMKRLELHATTFQASEEAPETPEGAIRTVRKEKASRRYLLTNGGRGILRTLAFRLGTARKQRVAGRLLDKEKGTENIPRQHKKERGPSHPLFEKSVKRPDRDIN